MIAWPPWSEPRGAGAEHADEAAGSSAPTAGELAPDVALASARRSCRVELVDAIVAELRARTASGREDAACWHRLAEALLTRVQLRTHLRGLQVGRPMFSELPDAISADVALGMEAVAQARALGDDTGGLSRVEASLMSQRITGWGTALKWSARIHEALEAARERCADDPELDVALGMRKLLSPKWLGHDPQRALEHFERAHQRSDDDRPAVFAGMACHLIGQSERAIEWLSRATERNPANGFAAVVLARLRSGEDSPFARDVTATELAALPQR